jgi:hypothetical protein
VESTFGKGNKIDVFAPGLLEEAETFHAVLIEKTTSRIIDFIQTGLLQLPIRILARLFAQTTAKSPECCGKFRDW